MRFVVAIFALALLTGTATFAFERVPHEVIRALGTARDKPISSGLVFINGKYLRPPYHVTRAGNQIQINCYPVTGQLVAWEEFVKTQPSSKVVVTEIESPEDSGSEKPAASELEKDGDDPAAPKDGGNVPAKDETAAVRIVIDEPRLAASADDLEDFNPDSPDQMKLSDIPPDSDEDKARQKRAEGRLKEELAEESEEDANEGSSQEPSATDENGDEHDPASPEGEAAAKASATTKAATPAGKTRKVYSLTGEFEENARSRKLMKPIDAYRSRIEAALRRGGYVFFGTNPAKRYCQGLRTDSVLTNELLKKLPDLMSRASDEEGFCDAVRSAGLMSYITLQIARDLYRHKTDSVYLKQRRRELAEEDKINKMVNYGR